MLYEEYLAYINDLFVQRMMDFWYETEMTVDALEIL